MYIYNIKVNGGKLLKIILLILSIFMFIIFCASIYKIFFSNGKFLVEDMLKTKEITEINPENYTNILQAVHDNPDSYLGMKIKFTGYIYRLFDFNDEEFVIARDMIVNKSNNQSLVVGFLCQYKDANNFDDGTWVNIIGTIEMGKYHNEEIPIIKITNLQKADEPEEKFVNPPDNTYIPTSGLL